MPSPATLSRIANAPPARTPPTGNKKNLTKRTQFPTPKNPHHRPILNLLTKANPFTGKSTNWLRFGFTRKTNGLIGAISPGELVTLFGNGLGPQTGVQPQPTLLTPYPTQAANVQVTFDGTAAPLLWVQDSQINLVAPQALAPGRNTQVCVFYNNANTNCLTLPVVQSTPAVFMIDSRYAAALNQNGTLNAASNPATPGSIVTVFATGLGPVTPSQSDGALVGLPLPTNVLTFGVEAIYTVGIPFGVEVDEPFDVQYAGPAPFQVAGVSQINFRIAPYASYAAIYLHVGSIFSPGFTIYVAGQ